MFRIKLFFAWYDCWIGAYYDRKQRQLYICPVPMVCVCVRINHSHPYWVRRRQKRCDLCGSYAVPSAGHWQHGGTEWWACSMRCWYELTEGDARRARAVAAQLPQGEEVEA